MPIASSNFTSIAFAEEAEYGVTPDVKFQTLPMTGETFQFSKDSVQSNNINPSRQVSDLVSTGFSTSGGLQIEWAARSFDSLIAATMWADWGLATEADIAIGDLTISAAASTITAAAGTPFTNLVPGQFFQLSGMVDSLGANNGVYQVELATDNVITVRDTYTLVNETNAALAKVRASMIRNSTVRKSFFVEKVHSDLSPKQFLSFSGNLVNSMSLSAQAQSILTGGFEFMGKTSEIYNDGVYHAVTNPNGNGVGTKSKDALILDPIAFNGLNAVSHVKGIRLNGEEINNSEQSSGSTFIQSMDFSIGNNLRGVNAIGVLGNVDVSPGKLSVTGNLNALFKDDTMYRRFISGEEFSISYEILDENGEGYVFSFPRTTIGSDNMSASSGDQDLVENMSWSALMDKTTGTSIQIDRIYAAY